MLRDLSSEPLKYLNSFTRSGLGRTRAAVPRGRRSAALTERRPAHILSRPTWQPPPSAVEQTQVPRGRLQMVPTPFPAAASSSFSLSVHHGPGTGCRAGDSVMSLRLTGPQISLDDNNNKTVSCLTVPCGGFFVFFYSSTRNVFWQRLTQVCCLAAQQQNQNVY